MKILFMSDLLPYYKETLTKELVQKGIKNFKLSDNGDNSSLKQKTDHVVQENTRCGLSFDVFFFFCS